MTDSAGDGQGPGRAWSVPGYAEVRPLGGGGFGEVVLATHDATGNQVAIKYLHPDLLADPETAALFRAEAATLEQLDSPFVVRLYEYVEGPDGAAIVMELVDGVTLAKILELDGKTTVPGALVVLYGSLLGLAAAHARGVVHRDYKPANVLVNGHGASKLTDFGIAALAGSRPMPTGTARYMPPEQFEGAQATPAADVYAATVTFYQCLTGRPPFSGQTTMELYEQHKSASASMDLVPEPLRPIVARGMAKDPVSRPADAGRLAAELRAAAADDFGSDWEEQGRSHLAEAALLLALLWPSGGTSSAAGTTAQQLDDPAHAAHSPQSASHAQPQSRAEAQSHPGAQSHSGGQAHSAAQSQAGSQAHPGVSEATRHAWHEEHVRHEEHLEHVAHEEHLEHVAHEEHLEHVAHLRSENAGIGRTNETSSKAGKSASRVSRARPRVHPAFAAGAAVVVVAAVAGTAIALTSHSGSGGGAAGATAPASAAAAGGTGTAAGGGAPGGGAAGGAAVVPSFTASFSMTRHILSCTGGCVTGPLPLTIVCHHDGSCTASSSHWASSHQGTLSGNSLRISGVDTGVSGCDQPSAITLDLTVTAWSGGNAATRKPLALSGPYDVAGPANSSCGVWALKATLTSA